jgi:hypothetical protein
VKINGTILRVVEQPPFPSITMYQVMLHGGPANGYQTIIGNTTVAFIDGHRYELNENGDFVYTPDQDLGAN